MSVSPVFWPETTLARQPASTQYIRKCAKHIERRREAAVWRGLHDRLDDLGARCPEVQCRLSEAARLLGQTQGSERGNRNQRALAALQPRAEPDFAIAILYRQLIQRVGDRIVRRSVPLAAALAVHILHQRTASRRQFFQRRLRRRIGRKR